MPRSAEALARPMPEERIEEKIDELAGRFGQVMDVAEEIELRNELFKLLQPVILRISEKKFPGDEGVQHLAFDIISHTARKWKESGGAGRGSYVAYFINSYKNFLKDKIVRPKLTQRGGGGLTFVTTAETEGRKNLGERDFSDKESEGVDEKIIGNIDRENLRTNIREIVSRTKMTTGEILTLAFMFGMGQQWVRDALLAAPDKGGEYFKMAEKLIDVDEVQFGEGYSREDMAGILTKKSKARLYGLVDGALAKLRLFYKMEK